MKIPLLLASRRSQSNQEGELLEERHSDLRVSGVQREAEKDVKLSKALAEHCAISAICFDF